MPTSNEQNKTVTRNKSYTAGEVAELMNLYASWVVRSEREIDSLNQTRTFYYNPRTYEIAFRIIREWHEKTAGLQKRLIEIAGPEILDKLIRFSGGGYKREELE